MKKHLLLLSGCLLLSLHLHSQSLYGTTWFGTNPPSPNLTFYYGNDTIFYSSGTAYTPIATYTASNGLLLIYDIPGTMCTDTGSYNYVINGNNLVITEISDACSSRRNTLTGYTWTLISTGITENSSADLTVYPNPSSTGSVNIKLIDSSGSKVYIYNSEGKCVRSFISESDHITLNLEAGIYICRLSGLPSVKFIVLDR